MKDNFEKEFHKLFNKTIRIEATDNRPRKVSGKGLTKKGNVKLGTKKSKVTNKEVVSYLRNYWVYPFKTKFASISIGSIVRLILSDRRNIDNQINNLGRSIILKAINYKLWGSNTQKTIKRKGFNKKYWETGQSFKSIKSYLKKKDKK